MNKKQLKEHQKKIRRAKIVKKKLADRRHFLKIRKKKAKEVGGREEEIIARAFELSERLKEAGSKEEESKQAESGKEERQPVLPERPGEQTPPETLTVTPNSFNKSAWQEAKS